MHFLIGEYGAGRRCVLIVDEAQNLTVEALEELRLLSNINSDKDLLLQIILVGQPELLVKLKSPELAQFAQRISISYHLTPLSYLDTRRYIRTLADRRRGPADLQRRRDRRGAVFLRRRAARGQRDLRHVDGLRPRRQHDRHRS